MQMKNIEAFYELLKKSMGIHLIAAIRLRNHTNRRKESSFSQNDKRKAKHHTGKLFDLTDQKEIPNIQTTSL